MDRSITLVMARRAGHERQVDRLRGRSHRLECEPLRERLEEFANRWTDKVRAQAEYQEFLIDAYAGNDRARDIWEPLLLLASLAGDDWGTLCQQAAKFLEAEQPMEDTDTAGLRLIRQIHQILTDPKRRDTGVVHEFDGDLGIKSTDLIPALLTIDEDYTEWGRGRRAIKERDVSRLLAPFKVNAHRRNVSRAEAGADWRKGSKTPRRYMLHDAQEVYVRYFGPVDRDDDGGSPETDDGGGLPNHGSTPRSEAHSNVGRPEDPADRGAAPGAHTDVLDVLPLPRAQAVKEYGQAIVDEVLASGEAIIDGDQLLPGEML
jgi:putative DNA primase/helicase